MSQVGSWPDGAALGYGSESVTTVDENRVVRSTGPEESPRFLTMGVLLAVPDERTVTQETKVAARSTSLPTSPEGSPTQTSDRLVQPTGRTWAFVPNTVTGITSILFPRTSSTGTRTIYDTI
ncbi:hypothetical protein K501DRAFT_266459 [Backusella circina FSU 941]|nr:hypothetical protein K501DRAFT_266459 [Backusella circina FSU 941]